MKKIALLLLLAISLSSCSLLARNYSLFSSNLNSDDNVQDNNTNHIEETIDNNGTTSTTEEDNNSTNTPANDENTEVKPTEEEKDDEDNNQTTEEIDEDEEDDNTHIDPPPAPPSGGDDEPSEEDIDGDDDEDISSKTRVESISLEYKTLDLKKGSYKYVAVNFFPETIEFSDEEKEGVFSSSNEAVATVSQVGKITGVSQGSATITYTTTLGHKRASMTVYVHDSLDDIQYEYRKLDDVDDISLGDELIFACPAYGVASSLTVYDGYILPASVSFSSDKSKITSYSSDVALYYVGPGESENAFTFETQNDAYLACRATTAGTKVSYPENGKAQINWVVEKPDGFDDYYIVSDDIDEDYWLMFNKHSKNDYSDIRFNIYDSSESDAMKKPTIYRKTIVR